MNSFDSARARPDEAVNRCLEVVGVGVNHIGHPPQRESSAAGDVGLDPVDGAAPDRPGEDPTEAGVAAASLGIDP